jgi:hypothetical protein
VEYIVKMDGMTVRQFTVRTDKEYLVMLAWARKHCRSGKIEIAKLKDCGRLPRAVGKMYPNLDSPNLVYKPFMSLT